MAADSTTQEQVQNENTAYDNIDDFVDFIADVTGQALENAYGTAGKIWNAKYAVVDNVKDLADAYNSGGCEEVKQKLAEVFGNIAGGGLTVVMTRNPALVGLGSYLGGKFAGQIYDKHGDKIGEFFGGDDGIGIKVNPPVPQEGSGTDGGSSPTPNPDPRLDPAPVYGT